MRRGVVLLIVFAMGIGAAVLAGASPGATCTAAQKKQRQAAVAAYRKKIPVMRAAYFKTHKSAKLRAAFVKRQQAKLKALAAAAACTVPAPPPPPTTTAPTTLPIPADEPGFSPSIPKPSWGDQHFSDSPHVGEWGPKSDPYWLPSTGALRGLILLVDFPGAAATRTPTFYESYLEAASEQYYADNSYGKLALDLRTFPRVMRMSKAAADYGVAASGGQNERRAFMAEATALVDGEVDFSAVDAVFVVAPESTVLALPISLYRVWPGEGIVRDGRELRWGVLGAGTLDPRGPSQNLLAHHFITHETGHLLGLADLYDPSQRDQGAGQFAWAGRWDIMSDNRASSHMFVWNKWLLGWLDPRQLRGLTTPGSTEATLAPLEIVGGLKAVIVPVSASVVYAIEVRQPLGEDRELCGKGVLVWTVDGSRGNADRNAVVQPAGRSYNDSCGAIYDAGFGASSTFEDGQVKVEVLEALANGSYRVRVTRK